MAAAMAMHLELEVEETGEFSLDPGGLEVSTERDNLIVRAFETLHPADRDPPAKMSRAETQTAIARARIEAMEGCAYAPDGTLIHPVLLEQSRKHLELVQQYADDADGYRADFRLHFDVQQHVLAAGRAELLRIHRAGLIEDEVLHDLEHDLDVEELMIILRRGQ